MELNIVIYDYDYLLWDENTIGIGGAHTWMIEMSKLFLISSYNVYIITNCITHDYNKIHFINRNEALNILGDKVINHLIYCRMYEKLDWIKAEHTYIIFHDLINKNAFQEDIIVDNYVFVSSYQRDYLLSYLLYDIRDSIKDKCFVIGNGVDEKLYESKFKKKNKMVWSSSLYRDVDVCFNIFKNIKSVINDFELDICHPQYDSLFHEDYKTLITEMIHTEGVKFYESLSKEELSKLQLESKIWIYNSSFKETFCITCLENIFADNVPIVTRNDGMKDYLRDYSLYFDKNTLNETSNDSIAELSIRILLDDNYRLGLLSLLSHCKYEYKWSDIANKWVKLFNIRKDA